MKRMLYPVNMETRFSEPTYRQRLCLMLCGLRSPKTSREYKAAVIELERLSAPITAGLIPLLVMILVAVLDQPRPFDDRIYTVTSMQEFPPPENELTSMPTAESRPSKLDLPELPAWPTDISPTPHDIVSEAPSPVTFLQLNAPGPSLKAPISFGGLYGNTRNAEKRRALCAYYEVPAETEDAVMRALRWLKANQQPDGSWKSQRIAMTGLAALTYLAHGEKPGDSLEFGETVQRAVECLLTSQKEDGHFRGTDGNEYAHPIATYALCEAYGMTLNPNIRSAAERALRPIVSGQHPTGGWTYRMDAGADSKTGVYRDDTSYMGWCAQALKAAYLAHINADGLEKAIKLAVRGFKRNTHPNGGFGYTGPGQGGLTGVGTLCLQLLGAGKGPEVKRSLSLMEDWSPSLDAKGVIGNSPQYYCYYVTQAKFHAGGKPWDRWSREMQRLYVASQHIERNAARDDRGTAVDIGWWANGDAHTDRPVMDTCLAALQLMVFYRNLQTTDRTAVQESPVLIGTAMETNDIPVFTGNL